MSDWLPGVHTAPNIQDDPSVYEVENRALDPERRIEAAITALHPWDDQVVCDLGAGTGFWIRSFHDTARHVFAVEPHGPSRVLACARVAREGWEKASIVAGSAERTNLASDSVDLVHARFAYFWGAGCEPGLAEVRRILRPGGTAVIIDNDLREGLFGAWCQRLFPRDADAIDTFYADHGFAATSVRSCWRFESREDLEAVVRLEFRQHADALLAEHEGLEVDYGYRLFHHTVTG